MAGPALMWPWLTWMVPLEEAQDMSPGMTSRRTGMADRQAAGTAEAKALCTICWADTAGAGAGGAAGAGAGPGGGAGACAGDRTSGGEGEEWAAAVGAGGGRP